MDRPDRVDEDFSIYRWWNDQGYPYTNFGFHGEMRVAAPDAPAAPNFYEGRPQIVGTEHLIGFLVEARWGLPFFEMRIPYVEGQMGAHLWVLAPPGNEEQAAVVVGIDGMRSAERAEQVALSLASSLVARLSVELRIPLGAPSVRWVALPKGRVRITDTHSFAVVAPPLEQEEFLHLQDRLSDQIRRDDDIRFEIMRSAMETDDAISGFLLLYSLLQAENGENQADLDARIVATLPDTHYEAHVRNGRERQETPFTRLRNDLMHPDGPLDIQALKNRAYGLRRRLFSMCRLEIAGLPL